jgi:hypothetical protein
MLVGLVVTISKMRFQELLVGLDVKGVAAL